MNATTQAPFLPPQVRQVRMRGFWEKWIGAVREKTAPIIYERAVKAGTLEQIDADFPSPSDKGLWGNMYCTMQMFWDSDIAKIIEVFSYLLADRDDPGLAEKADRLIALYKKLQRPDGYLNSWFLRIQPGKRWTNLRDCHELYCAGHLLEAAVAYDQSTGKREFLDIMIKYMDHIAARFGSGEGKKKGYPGHEEIELALMKLHNHTGERRFLDLASYFIDQRGQTPNYFDVESKTRGDTANDAPSCTNEYNQSHMPVREQRQVVGHAVRAMYLFSGMADVSAAKNDESLRRALDALWDDLTTKRLYVTGGMGPSAANEGFTSEYDLPNETAYAETCASIGFAFWAQRMLGFAPDIRYADMMELAIYNGALAGLSLDGTKFFYENPLESRGGHHRWEWHKCPCCPPNIARLVASVGTYAYGVSPDGVAVHLYCEGEAELAVGGTAVRIKQETEYPWDGRIKLTLSLPKTAETPGTKEFPLALRIPGWAEGWSVKVNGGDAGESGGGGFTMKKGYAVLARAWSDGDAVELDLPMRIRTVHANPNVRQDAGRAALMRGPLVYCLEGVDNPVPLNSLTIGAVDGFKAEFRPELLGGCTVLKGTATRDDDGDWRGALYREARPSRKQMEITAVPYHLWDNRRAGEMLVWLREE